MRSLAFNGSTINPDKDDTSIDGPNSEEWPNKCHLEHRDQSESTEHVPSKVDLHAVMVRLDLIGSVLCFACLT